MRLFYADPGLVDRSGHHLTICHGFIAEAKALGIEPVVLASKKVAREDVGIHSAIPTFSVSPWKLSDGDPLCGWLNAFLSGAEATKGDLMQMPHMEADDILFVTGVQATHLFGLVKWLESLSSAHAPTVVVDLVFLPGMDKTPVTKGHKSVWAPRDPRQDARAMYYRYVGHYAKPFDLPKLHLVTTHSEHSDVYAKLLQRDVTLISSFLQQPPQKLIDRRGHRPICVGTIGHQRLDKGYPLIPDVYRELLRTRTDIQVLAHNSAVTVLPEVQNALRDLAKNEPRLTIDERSLSPAEYQALLDSVDLMVCSYDHVSYRAAPSGVVNECFANAIPVVVPADTVLADQLKMCGDSGTTFAELSSASVLAATHRALDGFDQYAANAFTGAKRWAAQNGRFVKSILEIAAA